LTKINFGDKPNREIAKRVGTSRIRIKAIATEPPAAVSISCDSLSDRGDRRSSWLHFWHFALFRRVVPPASPITSIEAIRLSLFPSWTSRVRSPSPAPHKLKKSQKFTKSVRCCSGAEKGIERPLAALYINWLFVDGYPAEWDLSLRPAGL
jgi:hypothetical protein